MTKRYGRNQKRRHREQIAELQRDLTAAIHRAEAMAAGKRFAERRLADARRDALEQFMREHPYIEEEFRLMLVKLHEAYGPQLVDAAKKIMASDHNRRRHLSLDVREDPRDRRATVVRGTIEPLTYQFIVVPRL
jgi:hypothetical protein